MITETCLPVVDVDLTKGIEDFWRIAGAVASATAVAVLLAYGLQPFIKFAHAVLVLAG